MDEKPITVFRALLLGIPVLLGGTLLRLHPDRCNPASNGIQAAIHAPTYICGKGWKDGLDWIEVDVSIPRIIIMAHQMTDQEIEVLSARIRRAKEQELRYG